MKKLITFSLISLLAACATTTETPEAILYTEHITPKEFFAGAPQIPETTFNYPRRAQGISEANGKIFQLAASYLTSANENASPDNTLSTLAQLSPDNLNDYEKAFFYKTRAAAYMAKKDYRNAIDAFNLMLNQRDYLSVSAEANATKTLASLHFELQEYDLALQHMFKLPELSESLSHDDYYQVSRIQEQTGDYKNALKNVNKAILILGDSSPNDTNRYYEHMARLYEKMNGPVKVEEKEEKDN